MILRQIGLGRVLDAGGLSREGIDWFVALLRHTDTRRHEFRFGASDVVEQLVLPDSVLPRVRAPVSFLWGEEDPFGGPDIARRFVNRIPDAQLQLFPHAGHAVWLDDLDLAVKLTTSFLDV